MKIWIDEVLTEPFVRNPLHTKPFVRKPYWYGSFVTKLSFYRTFCTKLLLYKTIKGSFAVSRWRSFLGLVKNLFLECTSRIWPNNTILPDHIRSYSKIVINLFTVIPISECCYIKYKSNRLPIFQKFFAFRITSQVTNVRFLNNNETDRKRLHKK